MHQNQQKLSIQTRHGTSLAATLFSPESATDRVVVINSAMATPQRFYRHFATALVAQGYTTITWDYSGIGDSAPGNLRGYQGSMRDWGLRDIPAVIEWVKGTLTPEKVFLVGHSAGGQLAGLLPGSVNVDGMVTLSAQSAYWRMQGGFQKPAVLFHSYITLPLLSHLFGYLPWGRIFGGVDVPKSIALEWARWSRDPKYLLGDESLPLERFQQFTAPILAYSIEDDNWGTAKSVDALMSVYPNVERRHLVPGDHGLKSIGHMGYFRKGSEDLWQGAMDWLKRQ